MSVLIPSRGRRTQLGRSILSLQKNAQGTVEYLVAFDADDTDSIDNWEIVAANAPDRCHMTVCDRVGYERLHIYYNALALKARGEWLMVFNDDAEMETIAWDLVVRAHASDKPCVINYSGQLNLFPVVNQAFYEALGHLSYQCHTDTWIQDVSRAAGCEVTTKAIGVRHLRDQMKDQTNVESQAAYATTSAQFYSAEYQQLRDVDIGKVRAACVGSAPPAV